MTHPTLRGALTAMLALARPLPLVGQVPFEGEVRQLVTFHFLPGESGDAIAVYRDEALPLYERDGAMRSFRAFREVESPVPLDLIAISAFDGMRGMDESNRALRGIAEREGTSIGAVYGGIASHSASHHDQFVEMLPDLGNGDPSASALVALVWYRTAPGAGEDFERAVRSDVAPWEADAAIASSTGRFLVSDGWHYLRFLGFGSLGAYQEYWTGLPLGGQVS